MSTTTLRIEDTLRQRIARLAQASGQTPHNFMLEALAQKVDEAEWKLSMQRDAALQAGELGVEWHECALTCATASALMLRPARLCQTSGEPGRSGPAGQG